MICEYAGFTLHPGATLLRRQPPKLARRMHTKKHKIQNVNIRRRTSTCGRDPDNEVVQLSQWCKRAQFLACMAG